MSLLYYMSKKTKILYVITKSNWGGAQRYVFDLASRLPKNQFEVVVAAGGTDILFEKLSSANITTIAIRNLKRDVNPLNDILVFFELVKIFLREKPDIIHLNSSKIGFLGSLAAHFLIFNLSPLTLNLKPKIIFTIHGWAFNEDRHWLIKKLFKFTAWISLLLSTKIICVSEKIKAEAPTYKISQLKLQIIKNGIDLKKIYEKEQARELIIKKLDQFLDHSKENVWLGSIAELTNNKGLIFGLEALHLIQQKKLHWFILGEGDLKEKLEKIAKKLHLEKQVHFLGYLENAGDYTKAFDIYLLPSITESLGYTLLEAGLGKIPTIASNVGGIPEIIEHNTTGLLVEPRNPEALASALMCILKNKKWATQLGENLYKKITTNFSIKEMLEKTLAIYQDF